VITFRPRAENDDRDIVALHNRQEADSAPLTLDRYRLEAAELAAGGPGEQWVAVEAGRIIGVGSLAHAWWTGRPDSYTAQIRVEQGRRCEGIGNRLAGLLRTRLSALQATHLTGWVRVDAPDGRRFAAAQGFSETGEILEEYRLYVPDAATTGYAELAARLREAGLRILSLAEVGPMGEPLLRALQRLWADPDAEPRDQAVQDDAFAAWQREVLHAPGVSPETHWVALDGERPVGTTFLKRLSADAFENDYTSVAPAHRGRGIATALKLEAIAWARQHGVRWFYTSSLVGNAPMIAVNRRLGYQAGVRRLAVARELP
jgi:GNAT superfamily N-acetyltransferase